MPTSRIYVTTGYLAALTSALVLISQIVLAVVFDYPDITKQPALAVLQRYHAAGPAVPLAWCAFAGGTLMIVPLALLFESVIARPSLRLRIATAFGLVAALAYTIGIMRWVLVARFLAAEVVSAQNATQAATAALVFRAFDVYCGNSFGETIAPVAHGVWATILGQGLLGVDRLPRWLGWAQIVTGAAIALRPLEYVGANTLGELGDVGVGAWTVLLAFTGVLLVKGAKQPH